MNKIEVGAKKLSEQDKLEKICNLHKAVFLNPKGEELLEFLMAENHFVTGVFDESQHVMSFKEGQRSVIAGILERVDIPMHVVRNMTEEVKDKFADVDAENEEEDNGSFI